jgi:hypothetical protein
MSAYHMCFASSSLPEGTYFTHVKRLELGKHRICNPAQSEVVSVLAS